MREESRGFDVFFGCFVCDFGNWKREKCVEKLGREKKFRKNVFLPWSEGCLELFIALACVSRRQPLEDCWPKEGLILAPLERF